VELHTNFAAHFTRWVVNDGLLKTPFVLIDVGVQGGESVRWRALGDHLVLHGFDAIEEVVNTLARENVSHPNRHYHWLAAGKFNGTHTFYFDGQDPFSSSLYEQGESRFRGKPVAERRQVQVRRLDTLFAQGVIPAADFLKVDVEGYEREVLLGAGDLLKGLLGFEAETNFGVSCHYANTHFRALLDIATANHQRLFDIEFNRVSRPSFLRALAQKNAAIADQVTVGAPATVNILVCRDLLEEIDNAANCASPPLSLDVDGIIKQIIVYELYGLNDVAVDTVERLAGHLRTRIDVEKAVLLLADPNCRTPGAFTKRLRDLDAELAAQKAAAATRIVELEAVLQAHRDAHATYVRESDYSFRAREDASIARIRDLETVLQAHRDAHAAYVRESDYSFRTREDAYIARIRELEALTSWIRTWIPRPIKRLLRTLLGRARLLGDRRETPHRKL